VCQLHILPCASYIYCRVPVYCVYVLVIVDFLLLSSKLILGSLFSPHHVNQGGVQEITVPKPSVLDDLSGFSSTSMDVDPSSVNGETELNAYMRVQQVAKDTDPLMWWKQHQQEFPRLGRMTRQYLAVPLLYIRTIDFSLSRLHIKTFELH
jgi:hypothetical protein